jgi:hypothetical protein
MATFALFTQARGIRILRTSPLRRSKKFNQKAVRTQEIHSRFIGPYYLDKMRGHPRCEKGKLAVSRGRKAYRSHFELAGLPDRREECLRNPSHPERLTRKVLVHNDTYCLANVARTFRKKGAA